MASHKKDIHADLEHDPYRFLDELPDEWEIRESCQKDFTIPAHMQPQWATEVKGEWFDGNY